jgi:hypothetical protein
MTARLIDDDPEEAHRHALSAARHAGRIPVVRETLGITAYRTGDFALALRELRTHRRISGSDDQLPMMVDSERGLGRPARALELGRSVPRADLPVAVQVELAIAMSGARLDLEQPDAALGELRIPQLDPDRAFSWSPALFDAYAVVLDELGRTDEAEQWRDRADAAAEALTEAAGGDDDLIEVDDLVGDEPDEVAGEPGEAPTPSGGKPAEDADADADADAAADADVPSTDEDAEKSDDRAAEQPEDGAAEQPDADGSVMPDSEDAPAPAEDEPAAGERDATR